jgi:hypothetical protein
MQLTVFAKRTISQHSRSTKESAATNTGCSAQQNTSKHTQTEETDE